MSLTLRFVLTGILHIFAGCIVLILYPYGILLIFAGVGWLLFAILILLSGGE
jgi:hypothetical protein